ncbi:unnamed protein product, partial [Onchocerca ochengi]
EVVSVHPRENALSNARRVTVSSIRTAHLTKTGPANMINNFNSIIIISIPSLFLPILIPSISQLLTMFVVFSDFS